jgi:hypothetical protein
MQRDKLGSVSPWTASQIGSDGVGTVEILMVELWWTDPVSVCLYRIRERKIQRLDAKSEAHVLA